MKKDMNVSCVEGKKCYVYEFENFEKNLAKIGEDMEKK